MSLQSQTPRNVLNASRLSKRELQLGLNPWSVCLLPPKRKEEEVAISGIQLIQFLNHPVSTIKTKASKKTSQSSGCLIMRLLFSNPLVVRATTAIVASKSNPVTASNFSMKAPLLKTTSNVKWRILRMNCSAPNQSCLRKNVTLKISQLKSAKWKKKMLFWVRSSEWLIVSWLSARRKNKNTKTLQRT